MTTWFHSCFELKIIKKAIIILLVRKKNWKSLAEKFSTFRSSVSEPYFFSNESSLSTAFLYSKKNGIAKVKIHIRARMIIAYNVLIASQTPSKVGFNILIIQAHDISKVHSRPNLMNVFQNMRRHYLFTQFFNFVENAKIMNKRPSNMS